MTLVTIAAAVTVALGTSGTTGCVFCTSVDTTFERDCRARGGEFRGTDTMQLCVPPGGTRVGLSDDDAGVAP